MANGDTGGNNRTKMACYAPHDRGQPCCQNGTSFSSFAFAFASERLPSVVTATISLLIPLFAGGFAFLVLGEKVPSTAIPGSWLVVAGIVMILRQNNRNRSVQDDAEDV